MQLSEQINHPFFYVESYTPVDFFPIENGFYQKNVGSWPWESEEKGVNEIIDKWAVCKNKLEILYNERNIKAAYPVMVNGISLYLRLLFWTNSRPVTLQLLNEQVEKLEVKPVNIEERLQFLMERPSLYQSFVQLCELFIEQQKTYAKHIVMRKAKKA